MFLTFYYHSQQFSFFLPGWNGDVTDVWIVQPTKGLKDWPIIAQNASWNVTNTRSGGGICPNTSGGENNTEKVSYPAGQRWKVKNNMAAAKRVLYVGKEYFYNILISFLWLVWKKLFV